MTLTISLIEVKEEIYIIRKTFQRKKLTTTKRILKTTWSSEALLMTIRETNDKEIIQYKVQLMFRDGLSLSYISIENVNRKGKEAINHQELWLLTLEILPTQKKTF